MTITVAPLPVMTLSANQTTLCAYDTLQLSATGATSLNWSGPIAFNGNAANQQLVNPQTGAYQVLG